MPGPLPKPPGQRRRRNRGTPAGKRLPSVPGRDVPPLAGANELEQSTREYWATLWRSPMAAEWLDSDVPTLRRLAGLVDAVARGEQSGVVFSEIRHLEDRFGLSPMGRRKLGWELDARAAAPPPAGGDDDTRWLRAVSD